MRARTRIVTRTISTTGADLTAPTPPAAQSLTSTATTASVTYTHPGAPGGTTYALTVTDEADASVTPSSGSGLGPYTFPVASDKAYKARLRATGIDGQVADGVALVMVQPADPLAWAAPAAALVTAGTTSGAVTWATPTGGTPGYTYGAAGIVSDSAGASTTATVATAGTAPGATTVSGLVNGQTVVVQRTATDAAGAQVTVQAAVTVAATAAGVTAGTAPAGQSLAAGTTSATIGTWGAPSGGTPGYTYAVTDPTGATTISGSGLGPWTVSGLTDGVTYVFLLTITDSASAKGYSVVTISVAAAASVGSWEVMGETDFTDGDWTALTSTSATAATPQHLLYAADGTTRRAFTRNTNTAARTLILDGDGVTLRNGSTAVQPSVGVVPGGWSGIIAASRRDAHILQMQVSGYEVAGTSNFVHIAGISTNSTITSPMMGVRVINTGSDVRLTFMSYYLTDDVVLRTIPTGADRRWVVDFQLLILDGGSGHRAYVTFNPTAWADPMTGQRVSIQGAARALTLTDWPTATNWFAGTDSGTPAVVLYHDGGSATLTDSGVLVTKCRHLRLPNGSL